MHPYTLIEQLWWLGPIAAIAVGVLLGASPLAWPILATAIGVRAGGRERRRGDRAGGTATWPIVGLGGGITLVYATVGLLSGELERFVREVLGAWSGVGYVVLAVGAAAGGALLLARPAASCRVLTRPPTGAPTAFLLGVPLGIVNCPACAGVITGVAVSATALGSTTYSVVVMAALGVGHTLTLLLVSRLSLNALGELVRSPTAFQRIGGGLLLLSAAFFAWQALAVGTTVAPTLP